MLILLWRLLYWLWIAVEIYVFFTRTRGKRADGKNPDRGSMLVLWVVIFSSITAANWAAGSRGVGPGVNRRVLRIIRSIVSAPCCNWVKP